MPFDVELREPVSTPISQVIAAEAAQMRARGASFAVIGRHFRVDPKTVGYFGEREHRFRRT